MYSADKKFCLLADSRMFTGNVLIGALLTGEFLGWQTVGRLSRLISGVTCDWLPDALERSAS
jgi:hypothetical protein